MELTKVKEERQTKRDSDEQCRNNRQPTSTRAETTAVRQNKHTKGDRRDDHVNSEERADAVGEELMDKQ